MKSWKEQKKEKQNWKKKKEKGGKVLLGLEKIVYY